MRFTEILNEGGALSFPGFGLGLFTRGHYEFIANAISEIGDKVVQDHVADWFCGVFKRDRSAFKPSQFKNAAMKGGYGAKGKFQQRQFYYLAYMVHQIEDKHMQDFIANWLGDLFQGQGERGGGFNKTRWLQFCLSGSTANTNKAVRKQRALPPAAE